MLLKALWFGLTKFISGTDGQSRQRFFPLMNEKGALDGPLLGLHVGQASFISGGYLASLSASKCLGMSYLHHFAPITIRPKRIAR